MNAVETPDFKKLFGGGKLQRKYASKISPVADELADLLIAHAIEVEDSQGVYWFYVDNGGCVAWSIRQSDNILGLALTQIGAPSNYWQQQWYKLGKTITERIVAAVQAKMQTPTETPASEVPAAPQVEALQKTQQLNSETPTDESKPRQFANRDKNRIAELEAELATERSYGELARNHADKLTARINKLEADNAAYERIVIQAGDKVKSMVSQLGMCHEALGENQALIKRIKARAERPSDDPFDAPADILSMIDDFYAGLQAEIKQALENQATPTPPAQESLVTEPKFMLGQVVTIIVHIDKLSGIVIERKLEDNQWHYKVERPFTGITMWYTESELS